MRKSFYIIILLLFIFSSCKTPQDEDLNLKHINHIANSINNDLSEIRENVFNTAKILQHNIPFNKEAKEISKNLYKTTSAGTLISKNSQSLSAVYCPSGCVITDHLKNVIVNSEALDSIFISLTQKSPLLSQVYFLDTNSFLRIYPFIDVENYLTPNINLKKLAPFQTINKKPLINDKAYWLNRPFADPFGRGWIISCVEPIYYRDQFIGMLSGDITLRSLKTKYFKSGTELILLIDQKGKIICCTKEAGKITNIPQIREFGYYKPISEDIYVHNIPSLLDHKNKNLKKAVKSLLSGETKESFIIDNNKYTIYMSEVSETDWYLLKIIN